MVILFFIQPDAQGATAYLDTATGFRMTAVRPDDGCQVLNQMT